AVGCLACHGPGALPEAEARWGILRADVCATCHEAPPRYGHVTAWRSSAMSRADRDPEARTNPKCVGCHTTWGFLSQGQPRTPPEGVGPIGIACAACHDPHGRDGHGARGLLRDAPTSTLFASVAAPARAKSASCLACHAPRDEDVLPRASAAALWAGKGGV